MGACGKIQTSCRGTRHPPSFAQALRPQYRSPPSPNTTSPLGACDRSKVFGPLYGLSILTPKSHHIYFSSQGSEICRTNFQAIGREIGLRLHQARPHHQAPESWSILFQVFPKKCLPYFLVSSMTDFEGFLLCDLWTWVWNLSAHYLNAHSGSVDILRSCFGWQRLRNFWRGLCHRPAEHTSSISYLTSVCQSSIVPSALIELRGLVTLRIPRFQHLKYSKDISAGGTDLHATTCKSPAKCR
jgi:hypothetical protein